MLCISYVLLGFFLVRMEGVLSFSLCPVCGSGLHLLFIVFWLFSLLWIGRLCLICLVYDLFWRISMLVIYLYLPSFYVHLFSYSPLSKASVFLFITQYANYFWLYVYYLVGGVLHLSSFSALPVFPLGPSWTV